MTTPQNVQMERTGSHHIGDDYARGEREEVYGYFTATWRGEAVTVTMSADRYTHSSGLSDWRIYAQEARSFDPDANGGRGVHLTDTARKRLSDACRPIMAAWLESDDYPASRANAIRNMIVRSLDEKYGDLTAHLLDKFGSDLTDAQRETITAALAARTAYRSALETAANA